MIPNGHLLAWVEPDGEDGFIGAFVGEGAAPDASAHRLGRAPATQLCASAVAARRWIEEQAAALALPVKWIENPIDQSDGHRTARDLMAPAIPFRNELSQQ